MSPVHKAFLIVLLLMVSAGGSAQQPQEPQQPPQQPQQTPPQEPPEEQSQQPIFRAEINFVRVDVIVTDRDGNPITDLEAADFEVFEDDERQTIDSFKLVRVSGTPAPGAEPARPIRNQFDEEREAARADVRMFAIFLDDYHVRRENAVRARDPLINFIQTRLGPLDMVSIMYPLTPLADVGMTRNHEAIVSELARFDGRKYDYEPRNQFERLYAYYSASMVEQIRNDVSLSALKALVTHLGGLREGRKALILVSEGYTGLLPPQLRDQIAAMPGYLNPNRRNPFAGENSLEERARFFANSNLDLDLREVYNAANRNNTAIYALDPRGLAVSEFDIEQNISFQTDSQVLRSTLDTLHVLAEQTDGRAIVNQNDLLRGLSQMVRDSSAYYLLGYNSTQAPSDGEFHEIDVRVKRGGVRIRARKGYWALTAEETARALAPPKPGPPAAVEVALAAIVEPRRGRAVRTWVGAARGENGKTRVTFVWEPVPLVPGQRRDEPARVSLTASGDRGSAYFRGRIPDRAVAPTTRAVASVGQARADDITAEQVAFDADPGTMHMRVAVEGAAGEVLDRAIEEIDVPDFTGPEVALSTPAVFRARNALEMRTLVTDLTAVPVAGREFSRTDRLLIRFEAYAPGTSVPMATARLLSRSGQPMLDIPVHPPAGGRPYQVDLPLAGLAPGEYLIEITAAADGSDARELIAFRLVS